MPTADDYGQGVAIAALTDSPDASKLARDIANAIAQRSVMRFATAVERDATLTKPVGGMAVWLTAEALLTVHDGHQWAAVAAGTQAWTTVPLTSPWTHNANDNGDFQWRLVNLFGEPTLYFRGAIARSSYPSQPPGAFTVTANPLPTTARPASRRTIVIPVSDVSSERITLKMDIQVDGHLTVFGFNSTTTPAWVGFNGCFCSL